MNVNFDRALKSHPAQAASSEIDTKIAYQIREGLQVGIENYSFLGPMHNTQNQPQSLNQPQSSAANYLVADFGAGKWDFNVGIGHVSGQSPDKTVPESDHRRAVLELGSGIAQENSSRGCLNQVTFRDYNRL